MTFLFNGKTLELWEGMILEFYIWLFHNLLAGTFFEISIF